MTDYPLKLPHSAFRFEPPRDNPQIFAYSNVWSAA